MEHRTYYYARVSTKEQNLKKGYGADGTETQQLLQAGKEAGKVKESSAVGIIAFLLPKMIIPYLIQQIPLYS